MGRNIGIDFGTTNTVITFRDNNGKIKKAGGSGIKSAVYFINDKEYIIGKEAVKKGNQCINALVRNFKMNIKGDKISIIAEDGTRIKKKPAAIARMFLNKVITEYIQKRLHTVYGSGELTEDDTVVITVPVKFTPDEKETIKEAAVKAGFPNVLLTFEPTAAAIAAGIDDDDALTAVYDFGGGTFDISVIQKEAGGKYTSVEHNGAKNLGGNNITEALIRDVILKKLKDAENIYIPFDSEEFDPDDFPEMSDVDYQMNMYEIAQAAEDIKCAFSESDQEELRVSIRYEGYEKTVSMMISRQEFDECISSYIQKSIDITRNAVQAAERKTGKKIRKIVMAGGSSQIMLAQNMLTEAFKDDGIKIEISDNIFDLISTGALILSENNNIIKIEEKTANQFGIAERKGIGAARFRMLIDEDQTLPVKGSKIYELSHDMMKSGEIKIKCYEKDSKNYPAAVKVTDEGIDQINTYVIPIKKEAASVEVEFEINTEGRLILTSVLRNESGAEIDRYNVEVNSESDLE